MAARVQREARATRTVDSGNKLALVMVMPPRTLMVRSPDDGERGVRAFQSQ